MCGGWRVDEAEAAVTELNEVTSVLSAVPQAGRPCPAPGASAASRFASARLRSAGYGSNSTAHTTSAAGTGMGTPSRTP